jgi:hypothetical protein
VCKLSVNEHEVQLLVGVHGVFERKKECGVQSPVDMRGMQIPLGVRGL